MVIPFSVALWVYAMDTAPLNQAKISLCKRRLSFRLLFNVVLAVLIIEALLSSAQICFDYALSNKNLEYTALQILNTAEKAATHAMWTLDREGGQNLVAGLLQHIAIVKAELISVDGGVFSSVEKTIAPSTPSARWLFGGDRMYEIVLKEGLIGKPREPIGKLQLTFDTGAIGADFFKRTISFLFNGLLVNISLSGIILYVFHITVIRSIMSIEHALSEVDPQNPGGHRIQIHSQHQADEMGRLVTKTNDLLKAVGENIQRREKAEQEVLQLNQDLEARVQVRTRELELTYQELESFSYTVSHDLQGPLRSVGGVCAVLLEDYDDKMEPEVRKHLHLIQTASFQMETLIKDLLKLSQSTQGGLVPEQVNLSSMASDIFEALFKSAPEQQLTAVVAPDVNAFADPRLIKIVMENLINNAWKYTGKNANATIRFGVEHEGNEPVYFIRDNGVGFDMSLKENLFVPFMRLHSGNDFSGTGIGLATVQRIIHRHGGRIWAESVVGQGATFYFTLRLPII